MFRTALSRQLKHSVSKILLSRTGVLNPGITATFSPQRSTILAQTRYQSTDDRSAQVKGPKPELMIAFKCKKCDTRSSHVISKQAYTKGTILVTCPGCHNRHLIADHLKIFSDDRITIEDILSAKGESVSQSTDDLVFDEIPERLKDLIGHHAKDSPNRRDHEETENKTHYLPDENKK